MMKFAANAALTAALLTKVVAPQAPPLDVVPVDQEPHHKVVFANESIRVIDVRFSSATVSLKHAHPVDTVEITIAPGQDDAEALTHLGRAVFSKGGSSQVVTNTGKTEIQALDVEILTSGATAPEALQLPAHTLEFENNRVRIYRVVVGNGQSMVNHSHGHGWLAVVVKGEAGVGSYQWHRAGTVDARTNGAITPLEIVELEPK